MLNQKGIAHLILIFILLTGIIAGVFLVGKQQIFKPRATGVNIEFLENACTKLKEGDKVLICPKPKIKFISPLEVGNAKATSFNLVKTVYAAGSGKGYYCLSELSKIYHKEKICNPVLGILCFTWLSSHDEEKGENCDIGYECKDSTSDILNNVTEAKCSVSPKQPSRGNFQPVFIPERAPEVQPSANPRTEFPARRSSTVPTPVPEVSSSPRATTQTSRIQTFQTQGSSNNADSAGGGGSGSTGGGGNSGSDNTGTGTTALNTGTGATNPPPAAARTTAKFRFAEERDKLDDARWRIYTPGGTTIVEDFTFPPTPGRKAIFAQFMDNNNQVIKFDTGQEFTVAYIVLAPETSPSPSPSSSPSASSTSQQVACNGVATPSGGKAGENITIQVNYKGNPQKLQVWMAGNDDIGKSASQVTGGWVKIEPSAAPSNSVTFTIPSGIAVGDHIVLVTLHDSAGSMLDGNPGGIVNPKCAASLPILPAVLPPAPAPAVSTPTPAPVVPTPAPNPIDISCIGKVCTCGDQSLEPKDNRNPAQCSDCGSGGWCNGGKCATCSP